MLVGLLKLVLSVRVELACTGKTELEEVGKNAYETQGLEDYKPGVGVAVAVRDRLLCSFEVVRRGLLGRGAITLSS